MSKKPLLDARALHRVLALLAVAITLYLGVTGTLIELVDVRTRIAAPSPFDPDLRAMREDFAGPSNYEVLTAEDHIAAPLPAGADLGAMLARVDSAARRQLGAAPLSFIELRMADNHPVGQVRSGPEEWRFDAMNGRALGPVPSRRGDDSGGPPASLRNTIKHLHRMTTFGDWALWINVFCSVALATLIVTGVLLHTRVWAMRRRIGRPSPFWAGGGHWRALHRSISVAAALFLTVTTVSGAVLAYESLVFGYYIRSHRPSGEAQLSPAPLQDAEMPAMLDATLKAWQQAEGPGALRAVRLRHFAGYGQGVVITTGDPARQLVFNTATGAPMRLTEPGYPHTGFPFGWQVHQWAKSIHRGDFIGASGVIMGLISGLAMTYLSISGVVLYVAMWRKRRASGRKGLFWR